MLQHNVSVHTIIHSYHGTFVFPSPHALSQCASEVLTPAVVMPLAALQLPLTCSQVSYSWLPGYKLGLSSSLG